MQSMSSWYTGRREYPVPRMRSTVWRTVSTSCAKIMSTRGRMTSCTLMSPSSRMSWIMRFSSSSNSSLSVTMYLISSSDTL